MRPVVGFIWIAWPVPLRLRAGATGRESLASDTAALLAPRANGAKVTLMVQLAPAASDVPQLLVWVKSGEPILLMVKLLMASVAVPVLVRVRICAWLEVPSNCGAKDSEVEE